MADGILYLDVDDEITSVAARVRGASERRVAIVLPYGSRVATSRINFRLLSRDAMTHEKRLSIVASDAAARALAASAGLPVFSSVAEYESSEEAPRPRAGATPVPAAPETAPAAPETPPAEPAVAPPPPPLTGAAKRRKRTGPGAGDTKAADTAAAAAAAGTAGAAAAVPEQIAVPFDDALTSAVPSVPLASVRPSGAQSIDRPGPPPPVAPRPRPPMARPIGAIDERDAEPPRPFGSIRIGWLGRSSVILGLAVLALAALVGGVGAYLVLPSATVVVTPREEAIGPLRMTITADPNATAPDAAARVVPAETVPVDVDASGTYPATGKRVEEKAAKGVVRFDNYNPISTNTIPGGSIVSTQSDVRFQTDRSVRIPAASFDPATSTVTPASATVPVTAVAPGTSGNVPPNTITRVPPDENGTFLDVTNPNATAGGTHKEFPLVAEKDVTAAVAALTTALQAKFQARLADPTLVADGATVFPATGVLGPPTNTVDPTTFVGQQMATFDLAATASGTVMAVKTDAVRTVAEQRLAATVTPGRVLVDGSGQIQTDQGVVQGTTISFAVVATARQVQQLDPVAIRDAIKGHALADAGHILDGYGTWDIAVWPEWVKTIPTIDARLDVRVAQPNTQGQGASASPSSPSVAPSTTP